MARIINHNSAHYRRQAPMAMHTRNGAFFYSKEICSNIIPRINTTRPWLTINTRDDCEDGAIVFIHNNLNPENYNWLAGYKDLILVCGIPETCEKVAHLGRAVYLPLSVDVAYVEQFKREKTKQTAFAGRRCKADGYEFKDGTVFLSGLAREVLLGKMAEFKEVYAVGRCAIEAKILGCKILPYDERFPDPERWKIIDNREAAKMLQEMLDEIDN